MTDCPNGEMRDQLPDLLHDRLSPAERQAVEAHVAACAECRAELALLRSARASMAQVPAVNVAQVAAAIPAYRPALSVSSGRRSWGGWRVAAAITVLAAGGTSVALLRRGDGAPMQVASAPAVAGAPAPAPMSATPPASQPIAASAPSAPGVTVEVPAARTASASRSASRPAAVRELAVGTGTTSDLTERELNALLKDIESLDAVPSADVESGTVTPTRGGS